MSRGTLLDRVEREIADFRSIDMPEATVAIRPFRLSQEVQARCCTLVTEELAWKTRFGNGVGSLPLDTGHLAVEMA